MPSWGREPASTLALMKASALTRLLLPAALPPYTTALRRTFAPPDEGQTCPLSLRTFADDTISSVMGSDPTDLKFLKANRISISPSMARPCAP